jgi:hypothetical protein
MAAASFRPRHRSAGLPSGLSYFENHERIHNERFAHARVIQTTSPRSGARGPRVTTPPSLLDAPCQLHDANCAWSPGRGEL